MAHKILRRSLLSWLVVVTALLGAGTTTAQVGYPPRIDRYINDYAGVLESSTRDEVWAMLADLDEQTGIEATVLTVNTIHSYGTDDTTIESFATNLFNTWGIGNADKDDGLLILVAVDDRRVRIEVGSGYGSQLDQHMQRVIDDEMLPHFHQGDYDQGIRQGTEAAIKVVSSSSLKQTFQALLIPLLATLYILVVLGLFFAFKPKKPFRIQHLRKGRKRRTRSTWSEDAPFGGGSSGGGGGSSGGGASGEW